MVSRRLMAPVLALAAAAALAAGCSLRPAGRTAADRGGVLMLLTLNAAHGRGEARFQGFCRRKTIEANLGEIGALLSRRRPDVVALQEADGPSCWSGDFDHVERLAELAGLGHRFRGAHVRAELAGRRLDYGTALLARPALAGAVSRAFAPSRVTPRKGFVTATVTVPGSDLEIDVVSVHLDFLRAGARRRQAESLAVALAGRDRPLVVMGDFNCEWSAKQDALRILCARLGLRAFRPGSPGLDTYPADKPGKRLDWILISPDLEFESYEVLPERVSDHLAVAATVRPAK